MQKFGHAAARSRGNTTNLFKHLKNHHRLQYDACTESVDKVEATVFCQNRAALQCPLDFCGEGRRKTVCHMVLFLLSHLYQTISFHLLIV